MPYRYAPRRPVADLRQADGNGADVVEAPPADNVDEAPESAQDVLEESLEAPPKPRKRRTRKASA